jgi:hypothetical protein
MRFQFTLNMPTRVGKDGRQNLVHQVIGDYNVDSIEELMADLNDMDFIMVDEFYLDNDSHRSMGNYYSVGLTIVATNVIGKVKELK